MIKPLLFVSSLLLASTCFAQPAGIWQGNPVDSTLYSFETYDSLYSNITHDDIDTNGATLWDIGITSKNYFASGGGNNYAIMTDTTDTYPTNANDWFTLKLNRDVNRGAIVSFRHKYQTTSQRDGGMVEYSYDHGANWTNLLDSCNDNVSGAAFMGIYNDNFYTTSDTILNGGWGFSGNSGGWMNSAFQLPVGPIPLRTNVPMSCLPTDTVYIRFRFVSDDTLETLDGWMIDDIRIDHDNYWSAVKDVANAGSLKVYPSPSYDGVINFPAIEKQDAYTLTITNITGSIVMTSPYKPTVDLSAQPKGMYFYKATNGTIQYNGRLVLE
ncbi:MAG: T9SS type A sorting domain-containing protein [Sphingobacteriales bacterium]|nr:MAG: T9SS type A sorting domain-containing protein [Sphingobacteriales bacterium]